MGRRLWVKFLMGSAHAFFWALPIWAVPIFGHCPSQPMMGSAHDGHCPFFFPMGTAHMGSAHLVSGNSFCQMGTAHVFFSPKNCYTGVTRIEKLERILVTVTS
jgi:hypothetical protein